MRIDRHGSGLHPQESMKKPEEHRITDLIRSAGYDTPKSADFEVLQ